MTAYFDDCTIQQGLGSALVTFGLLRVLKQRFHASDRSTLLAGLVVLSCVLPLYGIVSVEWLVYLLICAQTLSSLTMPSTSALVSQFAPANLQGQIQVGHFLPSPLTFCFFQIRIRS
jgi:hypothetical protein